MKIGNRTTLQALPRKTIDVEFPEFDTAYRLREMNGTARDKFELGAFAEKDGKRVLDAMYLRARLVALCMIDDTGERLFADDEIHQLSDSVPASVLAKLFAAAQTLNGLDAVAVEDAGKNSESGPAAASSSA